MKEIKAYIKSIKEDKVISALHKIEGLKGVSVFKVKNGFGRDKHNGEKFDLLGENTDSIEHVKLEIYCQDEIVDSVVNTIQKTAHTGLVEDGKIYVASIDTAVRISTNERGNHAC